ncbi:condensin-2 complex subunit G2 [Phyllobates terribilis]|uniref:condensin-2 complex subunit G2 n=1 Tax=Phyllobates terribilis TaxID=111132 RepID=UPI003CCB0F6C
MEIAMSKREAFLQATGKETIEQFLNFIQLHKNAFDPFDLEEILQELPRKQKEELWQKLKTLLTDTLGANPVESWNRLIDESDDDMEVEESSDMKQTMDVLHGVATVATLSVSVVDDDTTYTALLECAAILNELLNALPTSESRVRFAIQRLCETWWEKGMEGKEVFGKTAIVLLLAKSLDTKCVVADIARLWQLHSSLLSFNYTSAESSDVKDLLLQCFMGVNHIKREEGRRFLSFLFSLDVNFIKLIHGTIKNQLQCFPKSVLNHIAEIYFRAWKKGSGDILTTIEHVCIQDLMHHGVHLPKNSPVFSKVRMILSYFHQQKLRQGVEEMLYRLYQPIMWRGLKARNAHVRNNAALLYVEAFPLRDPNMSHEEMENNIQKQFEELFNLLEDPTPIVRCTGVLGVCKITAKYWEMIPPLILADFIKKIIGDLAADITSAEVRASVFKCMIYLLENKLSHPLLEQMLPVLKNSLHDNSEKVRVAFVEMLIKIKAARAAKFWKVCPMEHLLARLEMDSRPVCRRLVNLMFHSFFPVNEPEEIWCERCVALIQMNPAAARKFYQYTYEHTAPTNIAKLMLLIRRCLNACLQKTICNAEEMDDDDGDNYDANEREPGKKANKSVLENVLSAEDAASMASLIEIVVILWQSIKKALEHNEEVKKYTISKFAAVLPDYFRAFKDERCTVALIILASFMPPSAVPTFSCSVLSKLRNLHNGAEENKYATLIDCLCRWGQVGHILELINDWMSETFPEKKRQKNSGRQVRIQDTIESKPELALDYMEYIITHNMNREYLLSVQTKKLNSLLKVLGLVKEVLFSFMKPSDDTSHKVTQETALRAFSLYLRLSIHLQYKFNSEGRTYLLLMEDMGSWIEKQHLALLGSGEVFSDQQIDLSLEILKTYLTICKDVVMVGLADPEFHAQILQIAILIIQSEKFYNCLPVLMSVLKEITEVCLAQKMSNTATELEKHLDAIQTVFHKALETAARRLRRQQDEALQLLQSMQVPLGQFIQTVQCWRAASPEVHRGMLSTIIAASVVEISHSLRKIPDPSEIQTPASVSDLPPLSRCLMSIVIKTPSVLSSFVGELAECIAVGEIEGILSLTASLHIIMVSSKGKSMSAASKNTASIIHRKLKTYREITMEDDDNIERALYESSMRTLDQLLQP